MEKPKVTHETCEFHPSIIVRMRFDTGYRIGFEVPLNMPLKYIKKYERDILKLIERDFGS
jgi:hypothetical protein